tara:strand:+ start:280 stop:390 length:111 start_codon:yes stop_codon:yes gene_type:complete
MRQIENALRFVRVLAVTFAIATVAPGAIVAVIGVFS